MAPLCARRHRTIARLASQLQDCAKRKNLYQGSRLHAEICESRLLRKNVHLGSALITMYAKCGSLLKAQEVFDELPFQDVVSWTALIAGFAQYGNGNEALLCFERMQNDGLSPNAMTFSCILRACGSIGALGHGKKIHAEIARRGLLGNDIVLGNAIVDMYAKCGVFAWAQQVMDKLAARDVVGWTALISGYCQHGCAEEALDAFEEMKRDGLSPNEVTFACLLQACGNLQEAEKGGELHAEIVRMGLLDKDVVLGNALVDMYAKCGVLAKAQDVFNKLPAHDVVSWTSLITGYTLQGLGEEALKYFEKMKGEGLRPNAVTLLCILQVCGSIGAGEVGEGIHAEIVREGLLGRDNALDTALVDMYAKCGALTRAQSVFDELTVPNVVSWTALMAGYAQAGKHNIVFDSFRRMIGQNVQPNSVTFMTLLTACSSLELVDEGETYFERMTASFGIVPTSEHYTCMVDLFSRAGHFDKALEAIRKMPSSEHLPAWFALLAACRKWGNTNIGGWAYSNAVRSSSALSAQCDSGNPYNQEI